MAVNDFFGDELRGYRLIKGSRLTTTERQNILVQTQNSTAFYQVRRALRTLFSAIVNPENKPTKVNSTLSWPSALDFFFFNKGLISGPILLGKVGL